MVADRGWQFIAYRLSRLFLLSQHCTHDDTASLKADYTVEAIPFIKEFEKDYKAANKKYAEKIIAVKGIVTDNRTRRHNDEYKDGRYNNRLLFNFCFSRSTHGRSKKIKARRKCSYKRLMQRWYL